MHRIMANVSKILFKRKSFFIITFVLPLVMVLVFSVLYSSNSSLNIAVINKDKGEFGQVIYDRIEGIENVKIIDIDNKDNVDDDMIFHKYEMVVTIEEDYTEKLLKGDESLIKIKSINQNELQSIVEGVIKSESKSLDTICRNVDVESEGIKEVIKVFKESQPKYNIIKAEEGSESINNSIGIMIYLIFLSAVFSTVFLIEDERGGTKDRILMAKVNEQSYFGGMCFIFFLLSSVGAIEYFIVCHAFGYEFGFENTSILLLLLLLMVLLSVVFNVLLTTVIKKKNVFNLLSSTVTIPIFMLSGTFWPYEMMSESLQKISSILPPRWFMQAVEKLQSGKGLSDICPEIFGLLCVSIVLFLLSIFFTRNKIVFVKDDK